MLTFQRNIKNWESVFLLKQGKLVPFFIETIQINSNKALVKFEEVDAIEDASELVKCEVYLPLTYLPELKEGEYYFHDLVGCEVFENDVLLGTVKEVIDLNGNELLNVIHNGKEVLIPIKDEILLKVSINKKRLDVELPDGLLDL